MKPYQLISFSEISKMLAEHFGIANEEEAFLDFCIAIIGGNQTVTLEKLKPYAKIKLNYTLKALDLSNASPEWIDALKGLCSCIYNLDAQKVELDFVILKDRQLILKNALGTYAKQEVCQNLTLNDKNAVKPIMQFVNWYEYGCTLIDSTIDCDKYFLLEEKPFHDS